ncbi:MAG: Mycothiol S-conjugate amidase [Bryobacteraceae bacterium]|nr:Mycothiol S-conjugate amidase [Bryobacteraceae bacterium]
MKSEAFKLLAVLAHPDDESLGFGGTLAKYAAENIETYLVTATRGERGRFGAVRSTNIEETGRVREAELRAAAAVLGVKEVSILGYPDGAVDQVDPMTAIHDILSHIRRIRPDVVLTFGPDGAYGHPDHIAISQFTTAAIMCAADVRYPLNRDSETAALAPHRVAKLHCLAWRNDKWEAYQAAFRKLTSIVDGVSRQAAPWPDWAVTTEIDTASYWPIVWKAVCCHQTQMSIYERLESLGEEQQKLLWGSQQFYRLYSTVNGGRKLETDLFEGLR